ncbi:hypothetical protein VCHC51A1_1250, partial [Vibrio cholerae HC-51A1]
MPRFSTLA